MLANRKKFLDFLDFLCFVFLQIESLEVEITLNMPNLYNSDLANNKIFWGQEYKKHGTYHPPYTQKKYFEDTLKVFSLLKHIMANLDLEGIKPSPTIRHNLANFRTAVANHYFLPQVICNDGAYGKQLKELRFNVSVDLETLQNHLGPAEIGCGKKTFVFCISSSLELLFLF